MKIFKKIGLHSQTGVFIRHLYLEKFDDFLSNPFLTLSFYSAFELPKYSLAMLIGFLEEIESACSIISTISKEARVSKTQKDTFKYLQLLDKSLAKNFRDIQANAKLALESS
jgi:hypothetical protein